MAKKHMRESQIELLSDNLEHTVLPPEKVNSDELMKQQGKSKRTSSLSEMLDEHKKGK